MKLGAGHCAFGTWKDTGFHLKGKLRILLKGYFYILDIYNILLISGCNYAWYLQNLCCGCQNSVYVVIFARFAVIKVLGDYLEFVS